MLKRFGRPTAMVVVFLLVAARNARAAIPVGPEAYCESKYLADLYALQKKVVVDGYYAHGHRGPWDDHAALGLHWYVILVCNWLQTGTAELPVRPQEDVLAELEQAVKMGCHDPMVYYALGNLDGLAGRADERKTYIEKAAEQVEDFDYAPLWKVGIDRQAAQFADEADAPFFWRRAQQFAVATTAKGLWSGRDLMVVCRTLMNEFDDMPEAQQYEFGAALDADATEPWLMDCLKGRDEIRLAWLARGPGWGNAVTDEGWKGFRDHLAKARRLLQNAQDIHPEFPQAASQMITVCMGESNDDEAAAWFARASAAQFDYYPSFDSYRTALMPRWGGSLQQVMDLGMEFVQTGRYDTNAPWRLRDALDTYAVETSNYAEAFKMPRVSDAFVRIARGYRAVATSDDARDFNAGLELASLHLAQRDDDAAKCVREYGAAKISQRGASSLGVIAERAVGAADLFSGKQANLARSAEAAAGNGNDVEAIKDYAAAGAALPAESAGAKLARGRVKELTWTRDTLANKPCDVQPDEAMAGWYAIEGTWKVEGKTIVGTPDADGSLRLLFGAPLKTGMQFAAHVAFDKPALSGGFVGMQLGMLAMNNGDVAGYDIASKKVQLLGHQGKRYEVDMGEKTEFEMTLMPKDPKYSVVVDDTYMTKEPFEIEPSSWRGESRAGICCANLPAEARVVVSKMKFLPWHPR